MLRAHETNQNRPPVDPELKRRIQELIDFKGGGHNEDRGRGHHRKRAQDSDGRARTRGDVRVIQTAIRELRYAFRLFAPYAHVRKVTIFGSARTQPTKLEYQQAAEFARKIVQAGLHGHHRRRAGHHAGRATKAPGRKTASAPTSACRGNKRQSRSSSEDKKLVTFKYFFTRKLIFIRHSDAIALFPGGFGTMDEGYEALTLMQTGKSQLMPLVLMDRPGGTYWKTWDKHIREHLLRDQLISPDDL